MIFYLFFVFLNIVLGRSFTECIDITIEREKSLKDWLSIKPSRYDLIKGGWMMSNTNYYFTCPHCNVCYYNWNINDNPLAIHKYLSPLCLFVLSTNPFISNSIPIKKVEEHFTDEDIINAETQPYVGLVRSKHDTMESIAQRQKTFERYPGGCPVNSYDLAKSGLYYANRRRSIICFYCKIKILVFIDRARSDRYLKNFHRLIPCRYIEQLNDIDPEITIRDGKIYNIF